MTNPKQYIWFSPHGDAEPCEAIQYDETNLNKCIEFHETLFVGYKGELHLHSYGKVKRGQWLIRTESGAVHVSDREPRYVTHSSRILDAQCLDPTCDWCVVDRRIRVLNNGITLPWEEVK